MPKMSKIRSGASNTRSTKPPKAAGPKEERHEFYCDRCGKKYKVQRLNFPSSSSTLYRGNNGYLSICYNCITDVYDHYKYVLEDDKAAVRRTCMKYDMYWNEEIYNLIRSLEKSQSKIRQYISKMNLFQYVGKTFDDTLDEEDAHTGIISDISQVQEVNESNENITVSEDVVRYWGTGFTPEMYMELENRREYWISQYPEGTVLQPGEEALLRQICNLEISINNDRVAGKPIEKSVNSLNSLLGSMNIKPSQQKENESERVPFGVEIKQFEDGDPIPEPDPEFEDVDNIRKNVLTWFLGSVCRTANVKNEYSEYFDEEIKKWTVERPFVDDEDILLGGDSDE